MQVVLTKEFPQPAKNSISATSVHVGPGRDRLLAVLKMTQRLETLVKGWGTRCSKLWSYWVSLLLWRVDHDQQTVTSTATINFIEDGEVALVNYNAIDGIRLARIHVDWFYGQ